VTEPSKKPDVSRLLCGRTEYLLAFAPVDLALEVAATREALDRAETWGDVKRTISAQRLAELVDEEIGGTEPPDDNKPFEMSEPWPVLRSNDIPSWLPGDVVDRFGKSFDSMLDSGVNFEWEDEEEIIEALGQAGITVQSGGPDLEELFEPM
jgi:hypothetical protein